MKKTSEYIFTKILVLTLILLGFGLIMIYSASVAEALRDFGTKWYFVSLQLKWAFIGVAILLLASRVPPKAWEKYAPALLLLGLSLLILVVIPGIGAKVQGARRWLVLPVGTLQPSELIKFIEVVYLSSLLSKKNVTVPQFLAFIGVIGGLIMLEPDLGTTIVVTLIAITMYYTSGHPLKNLAVIIGAGIIAGTILIALAPYRLARLTTFLNPARDPLGSSYHIRQVILALGSGGVGGVGIGKSRQKYEYLPESTTDSIFAVVGEEMGFIGAIILIAGFIYLISLLFRIATRAKNTFSANLAGGIATWIGVQVTLNLAAMVALTPLTGIPLPLVSYGGSALVTVLLGIGAALGVARNEKL